jgi:hypothetical protein
LHFARNIDGGTSVYLTVKTDRTDMDGKLKWAYRKLRPRRNLNEELVSTIRKRLNLNRCLPRRCECFEFLYRDVGTSMDFSDYMRSQV